MLSVSAESGLAPHLTVTAREIDETGQTAPASFSKDDRLEVYLDDVRVASSSSLIMLSPALVPELFPPRPGARLRVTFREASLTCVMPAPPVLSEPLAGSYHRLARGLDVAWASESPPDTSTELSLQLSSSCANYSRGNLDDTGRLQLKSGTWGWPIFPAPIRTQNDGSPCPVTLALRRTRAGVVSSALHPSSQLACVTVEERRVLLDP